VSMQKLMSFILGRRVTIEFQTTNGITIDGHELCWGDDREVVRKTLNLPYVAKDHVVDVSIAYGGDKSRNIIVKRDLFGDLKKDFSFHLNYDKDQLLESAEIYKCEVLLVNSLQMPFGEDISKARQILLQGTTNEMELGPGEFLYPDLKITISTSNAMGGEGPVLSYFYTASTIDHLLD
jgi:hypothetical protein